MFRCESKRLEKEKSIGLKEERNYLFKVRSDQGWLCSIFNVL